MTPETYLLPAQIDKLKIFNEDKLLKDAVRKVMLEPLYQHGVMNQEEADATRNFVLTPVFNMLLGKREVWSNEQIGEFTRASAMAIQFVEQGFGELDKFKSVSVSAGEDDNQAI